MVKFGPTLVLTKYRMPVTPPIAKPTRRRSFQWKYEADSLLCIRLTYRIIRLTYRIIQLTYRIIRLPTE